CKVWSRILYFQIDISFQRHVLPQQCKDESWRLNNIKVPRFESFEHVNIGKVQTICRSDFIFAFLECFGLFKLFVHTTAGNKESQQKQINYIFHTPILTYII